MQNHSYGGNVVLGIFVGSPFPRCPPGIGYLLGDRSALNKSNQSNLRPLSRWLSKMKQKNTGRNKNQHDSNGSVPARWTTDFAESARYKHIFIPIWQKWSSDTDDVTGRHAHKMRFVCLCLWHCNINMSRALHFAHKWNTKRHEPVTWSQTADRKQSQPSLPDINATETRPNGDRRLVISTLVDLLC